MVKFISICLSLLIGLQPIVYACENIEPIDPESLEYDPQAFIKKTLRTEGTLGDRAQEVGKALVRGLEYASDFFVVGGEIANGFFLSQSIHDLEHAINAEDAQGAILATVNTIAAIGLPIISEINPVAGIVMGLTLFEAQAIVSIAEQSHAYHTVLNQLHTYESSLEDKIRHIENRFISDIQLIALPQDQLHLTMAANTNFLYRFVALNASKRDVVSRLQDTIDSFSEGAIDYEMQQAFDQGSVVDLPLLNSNQVFSSVVEMEHVLSEHINELREQIMDADFLASNGFLHSVNTQVIDRLSANLYEVLPPIVDDMKIAVHSKSNLIEELTYENSRYGRLSYLSTHLDWLEEYTWLLFNHHFAQHPHLLGDGFIDPAVSTSVLAASVFIPVAGLVLLAVASPAIGGKVLANDYALLQQIIGLQNMRAYVDEQGVSILHDSDSLNAAITHFIHHSHAHPFIKGDELVNVLHEGIQAAREEALRFLPHALDADIHQEDIGDVYASALEHIEELEQTEEESIRFALDPEVHVMLPVLDQMKPMMTLSKTDQMNIYFSGGVLEKSEDLGNNKQWESVTSNSPYRMNNQVQDTAFFRVTDEEEMPKNENDIILKKIKKQGSVSSDMDDQVSSMPGGITMKDGKIVVEVFVDPDNAFATNVVYAHLDQIEDTLQDDLQGFIDLVANPQESAHALTWLEEAKDEAIMEVAIQEGFRTTCGIIFRQLINFLGDSDRSADAFGNLIEAIELDWLLHKNEVIVHIENEPVDYYQLDRIPGTQWVIDQYTGWAAAMQESMASNGWQATDRYPSELVDFIHENNIEPEGVEKMVAGYGMRMRKNSEWSRSAQSKVVMGAFPREVLKTYAQEQGMDVDDLTFKYTFDYGFHASVDGDGQLTWKSSDTVGTANVVESNQYGEDDNLAMWPMVYRAEKSSPTFSVFYNLFSLLKARVASGRSGDIILSDGDTSEEVNFLVSDFCEDNSSSGGYTEVSTMVWHHPYLCRMPVSLELVRLEDDSRFRGCVVEADLNLAEFIWMTRRRGYDHTQLSEVKMRAYVLNHQRYDHTLPHEGAEAKKTVDRDLMLVSEQVILDESDLATYRSGVLPPALTAPIQFNFNTTATVPVHSEFEISKMSTYCELICVEVIFNGVTEYIFYPKLGENLLSDASSSDGAKTANYHMYYYDYAPLKGGHIEYFNQYNRSELEELEYSVITEDFQ